MPVDTERLRQSVIAVPPLCRNVDLSLARPEMRRLADHLASGGVTTLLYGGNAIFHHIGVTDYAEVLDAILETAPEGSWVIPSIGPDFGKMMDQARLLRDRAFDTAMVIPTRSPATPSGIEAGIARASEAAGFPLTAYVKREADLAPEAAARLFANGSLCAVKYAVELENPADDPFLDRFLDALGSADRVVSGMGERPVPAHWKKGLRTFTSGSVCIAPALSTALKRALEASDTARAEAIHARFLPLETLRDQRGQIPVLHDAVALAGIAATGPVTPLLSSTPEADLPAVKDAARALHAAADPAAIAAE